MICVCASRLLTCYFTITKHIISTLFGKSWSWRTLDSSCVRAPNEMLHKCLHRNMFQQKFHHKKFLGQKWALNRSSQVTKIPRKRKSWPLRSFRVEMWETMQFSRDRSCERISTESFINIFDDFRRRSRDVNRALQVLWCQLWRFLNAARLLGRLVAKLLLPELPRFKYCLHHLKGMTMILAISLLLLMLANSPIWWRRRCK